jgi:protein-tyrosine-phosphatase
VKRFLFVCTENANRSQMAEAFAHIHGGPGIEAFSAGSRPSGCVNTTAITAMAELAYDLGAHHSKRLDELPHVTFDVAVTMGCGDACPAIAARRREDWEIPDPRSFPLEEFRAVRDLIAAKVRTLLASESAGDA